MLSLENVAMPIDLLITIYLLLCFAMYGFSNIFVITTIRKETGHIVGLVEFVGIYLGNVKNYYKLNKKFVECSKDAGRFKGFRKLMSVVHLFSIILIIFSLIMGIILAVFFG